MFVQQSGGELAELSGTDPLVLLWQRGESRHLLRQQAPADPRVTGLVFHMSRCGSTLLARIAAQDPSVLVLNEPELLNQVLRRVDVTPGLYRDAVAALIRDHMPGADRVVIKTSSWHTHQSPLLLDAFPDARRLLLTRDPSEVLRSIAARPPAWALNRQRPLREAPSEPAVDARFITAVTDEMARGLTTVTDAIAAERSGWRVVDYRELLDDPQGAASWLGADISSEQAQRVKQRHSKTGEAWRGD